MEEVFLGLITKPKGFDLEWTVKAICSHFTIGYFLSLLVYLRFRKSLFPSLLVALIGGSISVLIDIDHVVYFFGIAHGRPLHIPYAIASLIIFCFPKLLAQRLSKIKILSGIDIILAVRIWSLCILFHILEDYTIAWF